MNKKHLLISSFVFLLLGIITTFFVFYLGLFMLFLTVVITVMLMWTDTLDDEPVLDVAEETEESSQPIDSVVAKDECCGAGDGCCKEQDKDGKTESGGLENEHT